MKWILIHKNGKIIISKEVNDNELITSINTTRFEGTKTQCLAEISRLNLTEQDEP